MSKCVAVWLCPSACERWPRLRNDRHHRQPSLLGGLKKCEDWITIAKNSNVKWWATSALESNIGLNAIAQWVYKKTTNMKQGLGTGKLFSNNISSPYVIKEGQLKYSTENNWDLSLFDHQKKLLL